MAGQSDWRIGDPDPRIERLRRRRRLTAAGVVAAVAVPAVLYFSGAYDRWQDGRSLSGLCHGSVDTAEVKEFLGLDRMRGRNAVAPEGLASCSLVNPERAGGSLSVRAGWSPQAAGPALTALGRMRPNLATTMARPLGRGHPGVLDLEDPAKGVAVLALDCPGRTDGNLVVTVEGRPRPDTFADAAQRARFARIAARAADGAARVWGCTVPPGQPITDIPADSWSTPVPAGRAVGTCAGIDATTRGTAADPRAPMEDCFLSADDHDTARYRLGAYYPPFARALPQVAMGAPITGATGGKDGLFWGTASCPGGGTALYTVDTVNDGDRTAAANPVVEQDALRVFATRSAELHGCTDLKLP
ncbi:hypothetical protein ACIOJE_11310 [Kitasatospora sp. NPDC087861]|uniref:hypothetical protein n=1 Tax=Kitasatospora sp. NPDC087861 TaxID=3364070 RepID=UPI0038293098